MKKFFTIILTLSLGVFVSFDTAYGQIVIPPGVEVGNHEGLDYGFRRPVNYDSTQLYPLVIYLHCSGCNAYGNVKWYVNLEYQAANPSFVYTPLCPQSFGSWGINSDSTYTTPIRLALEVLDSLIAEFPIDTNRLYIHGKSMGGFGTINVISKQPGRFAAAYSECGGGYPIMGEECAQTPLWLFHGSNDENVSVEASRGVYSAIIGAGGTKVRYTEFPGEDHEITSLVDNTPRLNEWIFAQDKSVVHGTPDAAENLSITQIDNWTAGISWQAPDRALKNDNRIWYYEILRDGVSVDTVDAAVTSYVDTNLIENAEYSYTIRATNLFFQYSISDAVTFSTSLDVTSPEIITAEVYKTGADESEILISFNEKMDELSCETAANYIFSGDVKVLSAELLPDKQNVLLTTTPLETNVEYNLNINEVRDSSITKNKIASGTELPIVSRELLTAHIGTWLNPGTVIMNGNTVTLNIEGTYTSSNFSENIIFANQFITGTCTLSTRINDINASDSRYRAGILIRNSLNPESNCYAISATGSRLYRASRTALSGTRNFLEESVRTGISLPLYIRIIKSDGSLSVYSSADGNNWGNPLETVRDHLDSTVYVGLFATPLNGGDVSAIFDNIKFPGIVTSVSDNDANGPIEYSLSNNYPNPFNPTTTISYSIPEDANVKIEVYDMLSQKIATLVDKTESRGSYNVVWNAENLSSGIYYIRLKADGINSGGTSFEKIQKALLLK